MQDFVVVTWLVQIEQAFPVLVELSGVGQVSLDCMNNYEVVKVHC